MATTTTGKAIRQLITTYLGGVSEIGQQVGSGGSASTIVDTSNLQGRALSTVMYDGAQVRVTSGTRAGETSYVDYLDADNGVLHVHPSFTGALADTDEYEIWLRGVDSDMVDRLRDDMLEQICSTWRQEPITIITDGDLEISGVTHWNVGGGATRTKALGGFPDVKTRWQLSVVHTTAASDYVETDLIDCLPTEQYFLEVPVKAYVTATSATATGTAIPYTAAGVAIPVGGYRTSHAGRGWGRISILFTIPANTYQFKIRLLSDTNASTTTWGGFCCYQRGKYEHTLPDRVRSKKRIGTTYWTTQPVNSNYAINRQRQKLREIRNVERNQIGSNVVLWWTPGIDNMAFYYWERGFFARLETGYVTAAQRSAGDAATTDCPVEYAAAATAEALTKYLLGKYGSDWQDDWVRASTWFNHWENEFGPEPKYIHENEQAVWVPDLRI